MRELYPQQICSACCKRIHNSGRKVKNFTKHDTVKVQTEKWTSEEKNLINVPIYYCFYVSSADFEHCWAHSNLSVTLHFVGAGIAERVSALDWLSLRYAAIITLPVSNPGLCPKARHFTTLASSVYRDVNVGPVGRN